MSETYVHGYRSTEKQRLEDQARTLADLLHEGTAFGPGNEVLEIGCGVGAQTVELATRSPSAKFTAVDVSETSITQAKERGSQLGISNVAYLAADLFDLPFSEHSFDHAFVCFLLEHLKDSVLALGTLRKLLRPRGTVTVIEGDHGSALFYPDSEAARFVIGCQVELQRRAGGNAFIGRSLFPLLAKAGFKELLVEPRMVYVDASRPEWVEGFTRNTFTSMIEGVADQAIAAGLSDTTRFAAGVRDLQRTTEGDGVFCYTFFKATGRAT